MDTTVNAFGFTLTPRGPGFTPALEGPACDRHPDQSTDTTDMTGATPPVCWRCCAVPFLVPTLADLLALAKAPQNFPGEPHRLPVAAVAHLDGFFGDTDQREIACPAPGWTAAYVGGGVTRLEYQRVRVAEWDSRGLGYQPRVYNWAEEAAAHKARKARARAHHDAYKARLDEVRGMLAAEPALMAAAWVLWNLGGATHAKGFTRALDERGGRYMMVPTGGAARLAALAVAYAGLPWVQGQEGGTLGGVSLRGALGIKREAV